MTEHEQNLRDLAAMFALTGLLARNREGEAIVPTAFDIANEFMEARNPIKEEGIAAIKPKRTKGE